MDALDLSLYSAYGVVTYIDWRQTQYVARHRQFHEGQTTFLNDYPSVGEVNRFFAAKVLGEIAVSVVLPKPYKQIWLGGIVVNEIMTTRHNRKIGIKFEF